MKEDQPFQNFEIKEDLIGNSKGKKKINFDFWNFDFYINFHCNNYIINYSSKEK
jgi:hypothetical protein